MRCYRCRKDLDLSSFGTRKNGELYKACKSCLKKKLCEHGKYKNYCKECKGTQICEHNRIKYNCTECNGKTICTHNRNKYYCKDCKGAGICEHGRRRPSCKDCKGSQICEHKKRRNVCVDCNGSQICEHKRNKYNCKDCEGSGICKHDKQKASCRECEGSGICEHNRQRSQCKKCDGGSICEHQRVWSHCVDCNGSQICEHHKNRHHCLVCTPSCGCQHCHQVHVKPSSRFYPYCFHCYCVQNPDAKIPRKYKLKEHYLRDFLKKEFPETKMYFDQQIRGGCSNKRPDVRIERYSHTILIECDENQHIGYECENKRTMEIFQDLGNRPLVIIRFNPDKHLKNGKKIGGCFTTTKKYGFVTNNEEWKMRTNRLKNIITHYLNTVPTKEITTCSMFYDE